MAWQQVKKVQHSFFSAVTAVVVNDETEKAELQAMGFELPRVSMDATMGDIG